MRAWCRSQAWRRTCRAVTQSQTPKCEGIGGSQGTRVLYRDSRSAAPFFRVGLQYQTWRLETAANQGTAKRCVG
ncbi:hypothetical protein HYQ46_009120 [Verticillium longisporum]|nr:hypothetical protein HYQ46_009120 [Verticillium longisporum]